MQTAPRLHWTRGRLDEAARTLEWVGYDDARIVELRPPPPEGADWLACIGGEVVGRAALPMQAVRTAEAALGTRA
jgi:hypothetical protein